MMTVPSSGIARLARFGLTTLHAERLGQFYELAFGCRRLASDRCSGAGFERLVGLESGAYRIMLGLGEQVLELLQFDRPGRPYPDAVGSSDLRFQHFAIVVADMQRAYERLSAVSGWTAISIEGPQKLPTSSGGVTAFKFRDPEGHPLELLEFPPHKMPANWRARLTTGLFLGIDHSAIGVSNSERSIAFYEALGLRVAARSLNTGPEQERLDALSGIHLEVTALELEQTAPHVELLCYRSGRHGYGDVLHSNDVAATRLVFEASAPASDDAVIPQALIDPDGHHLMIVPSDDSVSQIRAIANADRLSAGVKPEAAK
jgi:catechol 2,3-dioxygenase-like lactoylglutathione lyase family enzyme